jgi:hypothetical protein
MILTMFFKRTNKKITFDSQPNKGLGDGSIV